MVAHGINKNRVDRMNNKQFAILVLLASVFLYIYWDSSRYVQAENGEFVMEASTGCIYRTMSNLPEDKLDFMGCP